MKNGCTVNERDSSNFPSFNFYDGFFACNYCVDAARIEQNQYSHSATRNSVAEMTHVVEVPSTRERYLCMDAKRFLDNICNELETVRDWCICRVGLKRRTEF